MKPVQSAGTPATAQINIGKLRREFKEQRNHILNNAEVAAAWRAAYKLWEIQHEHGKEVK